jgi:hypothetical protein
VKNARGICAMFLSIQPPFSMIDFLKGLTHDFFQGLFGIYERVYA